MGLDHRVDALKQAQAEADRVAAFSLAALARARVKPTIPPPLRLVPQSPARIGPRVSPTEQHKPPRCVGQRTSPEPAPRLHTVASKFQTAAEVLQEVSVAQAEEMMRLQSDVEALAHERDAARVERAAAHAERDAVRQDCDALRAELRKSRLACDGLQRQMRETEGKAARQRRLAAGAASLRAQQLESRVLEGNAQREELSRQSLEAMRAAQEAEQAAMRARQEADVRLAAATYLQTIERGRRVRAELATQAAEKHVRDVTKLAEISVAAAKTQEGAQGLTIVGKDGLERPLREGLRLILQRIDREETRLGRERGGARFFAANGIGTLAVGRPEAAALGLAAWLHIDEFVLFEKVVSGVDAIAAEVRAHGTESDKECLHYVLHEPAGSSGVHFSNGLRDAGRHGERFDDFVAHPNAVRANLRAAHVLALRLYTTAAFRSINRPLRDTRRTEAHPFAATVFFLTDGIRRLRAISADEATAAHEQEERSRRDGLSRLSSMMGPRSSDLWRGMANMGTTADFEACGGSELAPMSTTHDPAIALAYGQSANALLFKIVATSFMNRGADVSWLSAFPEEREILFAPLTYLRPTGRSEVVRFGPGEVSDDLPEQMLTVIEVEAQM